MPGPNVLLFIADGTRAQTLGCYGSPLRPSPALDAFAADGAQCTRSFCTHSVCMPTRASIFTGRYPHIHGVWANGIPLARSEVTLAQVLSDEGYATCASGKVHFEPQEPYPGHLAPMIQGPYYGFGEVHLSENSLGKEYLGFIEREHPQYAGQAPRRTGMPAQIHELQWITDQAIDFMERQTNAGRPFLCSCSFHELCPPCTTPVEYAGHYDPADTPVPDLRPEDLDRRPPFYRECYEGYLARGRHPDEPTLRRHVATYYDQMRFIDHQFQRATEALKRLGVWENTIVLFTSDHGLSLNDHYQWRHGPFLMDEVIRVPMIWRVPGQCGRGAAIDDLIEGVDIMPTVLDLCGAATPPGVQGRSLADRLTAGAAAGARDSVLVQERQAPDLEVRGVDPATIHQVGVRTTDWKLVHYVNYPHGELYNLRDDPGEFENLWADPGYRARRLEMESLLMDRLASAQDPLPVNHWAW